MQAAIGDVAPDHPGPEIVAASAAGPLMVLGTDGRSVYGSTAIRRPPAALGRRPGARGRRPVGTEPHVERPRRLDDRLRRPEPRPAGRRRHARTSRPTRPGSRGSSTCWRPTCSSRTTTSSAPGTAPPGSRCPARPRRPPISPSSWPRPSATSTATATTRWSPATASTWSTPTTAPATPPPGWPKLTGGWSVGTPGIGDWVGDDRLEVAQVTRDGRLYVWRASGQHPASVGPGGLRCDELGRLRGMT